MTAAGLRPRRPNGPVWLVMGREVRTLIRSKAFLVGNIVIVLAVVGGGLVASLRADEPFRLGATTEEAGAIAERVTSLGSAGLGADVRVVDDGPATRAEAETAVTAGRLDGALVSRDEVVVNESPPALVEQALNAARALGAVDTALADAGLGPVERETVLGSEPLAVRRLGDAPAVPPRQMLVALGAAAVLYLLLILYGNRVAQSIVEEKASRVVEVVLAAVRPAQLLGGKVLGIGGLSLVQALAFALLIGGAVVAVTDVSPTGSDLAVIAWVVAWFVPGYALYAMLFAAVGALVPREQDLQSAATPVMVPIIAGLLLTQVTVFDPQSTASLVGGLVPLTAPMVEPVRLAFGVAPAWEGVLSAALTVATVAVLVPITARLYAGGVLHTRTSISPRRAWAGAQRRERATP
jgi:ABC-2 type transport system permease protein